MKTTLQYKQRSLVLFCFCSLTYILVLSLTALGDSGGIMNIHIHCYPERALLKENETRAIWNRADRKQSALTSTGAVAPERKDGRDPHAEGWLKHSPPCRRTVRGGQGGRKGRVEKLRLSESESERRCPLASILRGHGVKRLTWGQRAHRGPWKVVHLQHTTWAEA